MAKLIVADENITNLYNDLDKKFLRWAKANVSKDSFENGLVSKDTIELFEHYNKFFPKLDLKSIDDVNDNEREILFKTIKTQMKKKYEQEFREQIEKEYHKNYIKKMESDIKEEVSKKVYEDIMKMHGEEYKKKVYNDIKKPIDQLNKILLDLDMTNYSDEMFEKKLKDTEKLIDEMRQKRLEVNGYYDVIKKLIPVNKEYCKKHIVDFKYTKESHSDGMEYGSSSGSFEIEYTFKSDEDTHTTVTIKAEMCCYGRYIGADDENEIKLSVSGCKKNCKDSYELFWNEFIKYEDSEDDDKETMDPRYIAFEILSKYQDGYRQLM